MNFDTGAEIKHATSELSRDWVGLAIDPCGALLIIGIAAADQGVGRDPRSWQELYANSRREIKAGEVVSLEPETSRSGFARALISP